MGISRAGAHDYNVCDSLRPHHSCRDGVCCTRMIILGYLFCFAFVVRFDFYLLGRLFILQFDIEFRSQTHKEGEP